MSSPLEDSGHHSRFQNLGRNVLAFFVLLIAGWIIFNFLFHIVAAVFTVVLILLAIVALIWALRVLL